MPRISPLLWLLGFTSLAATQSPNRYDSANHFIYPPTPVNPGDFSSASNITRGQVTFEWVTNIAVIGLSIYQEGNSYYPILIGPYSGNSYTWNGSISDLGHDNGPWPNFDAYGNTFFLGIRDWDSNNSNPLFYSRYFHLVDAEVSTSTVASTTTSSPTSSSQTVSTSTGSSTTSAAAQSSTSSSGSSTNVLAIGAGVGVGVGVPLLIALGVIIWLLSRRQSKAQHEPSMAKTESSHQLHGSLAHGSPQHDRPVELPSSIAHPPAYRSA